MKRLREKLSFSLRQREVIMGYLFTLPFLIGFFAFILHPFIQSIYFSISELELTREGFNTYFVGLENYMYALQVHSTFVPEFVTTIGLMVGNSIWILVFSFFAAILLNQKFRGQLLARLVFFLPVIMLSGIVLQMEQGDYALALMEAGEELGLDDEALGFLTGAEARIRSFLMQLRLPEEFLEFILGAIDQLPNIVRSSGVQILIFLAGLQSIPPSLYESARVEGASGWESFWKITLPMLSPLILTNIIYTIVDFFTNPQNPMIELINNATFEGAGFGVGSAMAWMYFMSIGIILAIVMVLCSRFVFYHE